MEQKKLVITGKCERKFEPIVDRIEDLLSSETDPVLFSIDGMCASGKTTLSYYLAEKFDCNLFHMDDFFLQKEQRTIERLEEIGGNVDYERFQKEVLNLLLDKRAVYYRPYNCEKQKITEGIIIPYKRLNLVEGSYSLHPYFGDVYHGKAFLEIPEELQIKRVINRNGEKMLDKFIKEWIPKENKYFNEYKIREGCIVI